MCLESLEELLKHFLFGLLAGANIRMLLGIITLSDIIDIDVAILVEVELFEDAFDQVLPERAHVTLDSVK